MKAIQVESAGGPEVLRLWELDVPEPKEGEARVRVVASGVNFIDIYHRSGLYPVPLPFTPGMEAAGEVEAVGPNTSDVKVGDRVVYAMVLGAYAECAIVPAWRLVKVPEEIGTMHAAAVFLQGLTAHYLTRASYAIQPGDTILVHAAAGGVGNLLTQVAKHLGAKVIGTVSTDEKAQIAKEAGADEVILYSKKNFLSETLRITEKKGVNVVYDSVGQATFERSIQCLKPRGTLVLFGQSSGPVAPFNPALLAKNSLFLTRPSLAQHTLTHEELQHRADELFEWIASGVVKIRIDRTMPLSDAAKAQRTLESRASKGKILLVP